MSATTPFYDRNKPERLNPLDDSQIDMQENFQVLYETFAKNHVAISSPGQTVASEQGKHNIVELVTNKNNQQTKSGEISLFTKNVNDGVDDIAQLFLNMQANSTVHQMTTYQNVRSEGNTDYTFLPGGFIWYFGSAQMDGGKATVTLNPAPYKDPKSLSKSGKIVYAAAQMRGTTGQDGPQNYIVSVVASEKLVYFYDSKATLNTFKRNFTGRIYYNIIAIYKGNG